MPKVRIFTGGAPETDASTFYRLVAPARVLTDEGADIEISQAVPGVIWQDVAVSLADGRLGKDSVVRGLQPLDCDIAIFQRPLMRNMADVIELAAQQCTVVVDIDDDFQAVPADNVAYGFMDPKTNPLRNWEHLWRATRAADMVTVTTQALARRYGKGGKPTAVLPNCVPRSYLHIGPDDHEGLRLGWTGSVETHPHDLEVTRGAAGRALRSQGGRLHIVGTGIGVAERLGHPVDSCCGWVPLAEYPQRMSAIDVGIVPLHSCAFNHGKSYLKGLEFAALGVPFVASPVQSYIELHRKGAGVLAHRGPEWERELTKLLKDEGYREEVAGLGRLVAEKETYENQAGRWFESWCGALAEKRSLALV